MQGSQFRLRCLFAVLQFFLQMLPHIRYQVSGADARARLSAVSGAPSSVHAVLPHSDLDELAEQAPTDGESLPDALIALFQSDPSVAAALADFLSGEGATSRKDILEILRANGGNFIMNRAQWAEPALSGLHFARLEAIASQCNPSHAESSQQPPSTAQEQRNEPSDEAPADFGMLRPLLDAAAMGEPTEEGIPRHGMLKRAVAAASKHTLPDYPAIDVGTFPRQWRDRPLSRWLRHTVRQFWALSVTGVTGVGDCFNRLTHVACIANDARYPPNVAERAAVRYDAECFQGVCLRSLKARSGDNAREILRSSCEEFSESKASRLLAEEARVLRDSPSEAPASDAGIPDDPSRTVPKDALKKALSDGAQLCFLWAVGKCSKTEQSCGKVHACPICNGVSTKGCLLKNHSDMLARHIKTNSAGDVDHAQPGMHKDYPRGARDGAHKARKDDRSGDSQRGRSRS